MANRIIPKRSSVASKIPLASDLSIGELAINLADHLLYSKDAGGNVFAIGGGGGASFPSQTGNSGKFLTTDGSTVSWGSITASTIGLGNVENKSSATIRGELTSSNVTTALGFTPYNATNPNGYTTNTGTVTSVAMTVPTGLSISGTPITGSGTLAVTFTSGYSIPTTASQTNWNTAYGWGNHASAGYLTGITSGQVTTALGFTPLSSSTTVTVAQGGTGATTLTGLVYGNGTSAMTAATAAQIVAAIGSTAVASATNADTLDGNHASAFYLATNPNGYTSNTGTVTSVGGTGTVSGLTLTGTVTGSGNLTLGGTLTLTSANVTSGLGYTPATGNGSLGTTDLNTATTSGMYRIDVPSANGPGVSYGQLLVIHGSGDTITQLVGDYSTGSLFTRSGNPTNVGGTGSWQAWRKILDANNYTDYTVTKTGSGASGSWGISVTGSSGSCTGNAASASELSVPDLRSTALTPSYFGQGLNTAFMANTTDGLADGGLYHGILQFQQWTDASGGGAHQLGFTDNNSVWHRGSSGALSAWGTWYKFLDSGNYSSYALPLSGGTMSGNLNIQNTSPTIYLLDTDNRSSMIHCNSNYFYVLRGTGNGATGWTTYNGYWPMQLYLENNDVTFGGNLTAVYNVTAYSDERKKKNWRGLSSNFVELLAGIKSGVYDRIDDGVAQAGVSAQSLQVILPESVMEGMDGYLTVAYGNAAMVSAVELAKEVVNLKSEISELKALVAKLIKE